MRASMYMTIKWQRRRAEVKQNATQAAYNKLDEGAHPCHVLGLFPCTENEEYRVYFICELNDGRCIYATPHQVRFVDTDKNGEIVDVENSN